MTISLIGRNMYGYLKMGISQKICWHAISCLHICDKVAKMNLNVTNAEKITNDSFTH